MSTSQTLSTQQTHIGERESISFAHQNRRDLPRSDAPCGLSKTHMRSDFYVASDPERVRIQQEEHIAKQIKDSRLFKPSPYTPYGLGGPAGIVTQPELRQPGLPQPHNLREERQDFTKRLTEVKKEFLRNEVAKAQQKSQAQPKTQTLEQAKAAFVARWQNRNQPHTHER